jgi:hypothetical protein
MVFDRDRDRIAAGESGSRRTREGMHPGDATAYSRHRVFVPAAGNAEPGQDAADGVRGHVGRSSV